jgi:hypothetical protein
MFEEFRILNRTGTFVCVAEPVFVNEACGVIGLAVLRSAPFCGSITPFVAMSFVGGRRPFASSAPRSGGVCRG